jgi:hypothetical protein
LTHQASEQVVHVQVFRGKEPRIIPVPLRFPLDEEACKKTAKERFVHRYGGSTQSLRAKISKREKKRLRALERQLQPATA